MVKAMSYSSTFYSVGGGVVVSESVLEDGSRHASCPGWQRTSAAFPYGDELLVLTQRCGISIAEVMRRNELHWRPDAETRKGLLSIWGVMKACVERGCRTEGTLPGDFRCAAGRLLFRKLHARPDAGDPWTSWIG